MCVCVCVSVARRPDTSCPFVQPSDVQHPQLPSAAGLYRLVAPAPKIRVHALDRTFDLPVPVPAMSDNDANSSLSALYGAGGLFDDAALIASMAAPGRPRPYTPAPLRFATVEDSDDESDAATANVATIAPSARAKAAAASRRVRRRSASAEPADAAAAAAAPVARPTTLKDAVAQFMNCPHPLTTLTEYGAYGPNGSISRYHNPRNYTLVGTIGPRPHTGTHTCCMTVYAYLRLQFARIITALLLEVLSTRDLTVCVCVCMRAGFVGSVRQGATPAAGLLPFVRRFKCCSPLRLYTALPRRWVSV